MHYLNATRKMVHCFSMIERAVYYPIYEPNLNRIYFMGTFHGYESGERFIIWQDVLPRLSESQGKDHDETDDERAGEHLFIVVLFLPYCYSLLLILLNIIIYLL